VTSAAPASYLLPVTKSGTGRVTLVAQRVRKRRDALRAAGLRPERIWVPDTSRPGFAEEGQRQSVLVAEADAADRELNAALDADLADPAGPCHGAISSPSP
jgi:hypothetical protein